jgi:site-specific DNA-cytosine methylase
MKDKIILDLCGGTGAWSKPYKDAGYDVRVITLPEFDVRRNFIPPKNVYGILAAPPCTYFAVSGNRWPRTHENYLEALSIVDACLRIIFIAKPKFWALENPVGTLHRWIGKPVMYFNPCDYGDAYTKKTCLWGEFNKPIKTPIKPVFVIRGGKKYSPIAARTGGRSAKTKEVRSITPQGFANAFFKANQ